ncbi:MULTISPECIES: hypothetical protein [Spiroplasma]|uniref:Uncharacterized protein n=3 Tax=Spiroplasma TaxID=2132 RepID=Q14M44_SPICI|nr:MULTISPECIES: hypothetical protein [Spiroplasma]APE74447.1 hypothetical protein SCITRI_00548 [Spiroplasma citri]AXF95383.1 hypothetical protein SDAV_00389 [Spiroplasma phoeniceum P40]ELL44225.1 hypothetical protein SMIPMB4A_v3c8560 [Spiroplasma melliferum IPMB4A]QCO23686.1 hypothetical protein SRED_002157 [Spiroplasma melliferum]QJU61427.1 hypothetical protein HHA36_02745 [Spiroplasma citri]
MERLKRKSYKVQLKVPIELYEELQKFIDDEHSLAYVIKHLIKKGIQNYFGDDE